MTATSMKLVGRAIAGLATGALLLAACTAPPTAVTSPTPEAQATKAEAATSGGTLIWITDRDLTHYDIYQSTVPALIMMLAPAYSNLVRYDPLDVNKIVPDLAERWDVTADGLVYTFHLRSGVKFHDGVTLTSEDVKFSLDRLSRPTKPDLSFWRSWFDMIDRVDAPDSSTVKITLKYPAAQLIAVLGMGFSGIVPKHIVDAKGDMKRDIIGTGPFKLKEQRVGVSLEYVKNEDYFVKGRPYLDGIKFVVIRDEAARFAAFQTGNAHITAIGGAGLTADQANQLEKTKAGEITVWRHADLSSESLFFNISKEPWSDIRVRRAVHLAFDRQAYGQLIFGGNFNPGAWLAPEAWVIPRAEVYQMPGFRQPKEADRTEARRLLAEAGFPNGFQTTILTQSQAADVRRAEFVRDQLGTIGITVRLDVKEPGAFFEARDLTRNYDIVRSSGAQIVDPSAPLFELYYSTGPRNYSRTTFPEIDRLIDAQARELVLAKRKAIVLEVQHKLFELLPAVPLGNEVTLTGSWKTVRGWAPHDGRLSHGPHIDTWLGP